MLVPGTDRLALGEQMFTARPADREASQGNNPADLQGVPARPRSDSMFATSEFTECLPAQRPSPGTRCPQYETTGMRTVPTPHGRRDRESAGFLLGFVVRRAHLGGDPAPLAHLVAVLLGPGPGTGPRHRGGRTPGAPRRHSRRGRRAVLRRSSWTGRSRTSSRPDQRSRSRRPYLRRDRPREPPAPFAPSMTVLSAPATGPNPPAV